MVIFLFIIIKLFFTISYALDVISRNLSNSEFFKGVGHFECKFQMEGASSTNHCWCQKTRVIALSCGIKTFAVHCLVLSPSTHVTGRPLDRSTTPKTALA